MSLRWSAANPRFYPTGTARRHRRRGVRRAAQQRIEPAGAVERDQVVEAADVGLADVDLRHRAPPGLGHHLDAARGLEVDPHLRDVRHALRVQEALRPDAVRAHGRRVHHDWGQDGIAPRHRRSCRGCFERQPGVLPRLEAAVQHVDAGEAELRKDRRPRRGCAVPARSTRRRAAPSAWRARRRGP